MNEHLQTKPLNTRNDIILINIKSAESAPCASCWTTAETDRARLSFCKYIYLNISRTAKNTHLTLYDWCGSIISWLKYWIKWWYKLLASLFSNMFWLVTVLCEKAVHGIINSATRFYPQVIWFYLKQSCTLLQKSKPVLLPSLGHESFSML